MVARVAVQTNFFAVAQAIRNVLKYFFAMAGLAATLGGLCAVLVLEFTL